MARQVARTTQLSIGEPSFIASAAAYWESKGDQMEKMDKFAEMRMIVAKAKERGELYRKATHNYHLGGRPTTPIDLVRKDYQLETGAKWKALREKTGVSRQRLAKKLEIGINMMAAFEIGDKPISTESFDSVLAKVTKYFTDCYGNLLEE